MPEPSLQDILSMRPDPELATGNTGIVYDTKDLVHTLNQAAQQKAENDWRKYNMFMGNLKEVYKDLNEIAKQPVLTEDRDKLKQTMGEIMKGISSDPKGFFGGGAKYQETLARLAQLQSETTESKQNNLYDTAHRQFFYANPNLATPKNMALIDDYRKQPLGARTPYMLELPPMFDMKGAFDNLNKIAVSKTETPTGAGHIKNVEGVDPAKWNEAARALFFTGKDVKEYFAQRFEEAKKASPSSVAPYANSQNPVLDFYLDVMKGGQQATSRTLSPDQAWQTRQQTATSIKTANISAATSRQNTLDNIYAETSKYYKPIKIGKGGLPINPEDYDWEKKGGWKDKWGQIWVPNLASEAATNLKNATAEQKRKQDEYENQDVWSETMVPRLKELLKEGKKDKDSYDIEKIPGLTSMFTGEIFGEEGKRLGISGDSKIDIQVDKNGEPIAIVIDGLSYDKAEFNRLIKSARKTKFEQTTPVPGNE